MDKLIAFLSNPSVRRLAVFLLGFLTVVLHKKLNLDLDPNEVFAAVLATLGYVGQSAVREAVVAHADAKVAIADALADAKAPAAAPVPPSPAP